MNKEWRLYIAEGDASWLIYADAHVRQTEADITSPSGRVAETQMLRPAAPMVLTSIVPRADEDPARPGQYHQERDFHLLLQSVVSDWTALSRASYKKDEVLKLAEFFVGMTDTQAKKFWRMKNLGPESLRIELEA